MAFRQALNVFDLQEIARRRLPRGVYGFVEGGVEDNRTRDNNREVFDRIRFRPRMAVDVSQRSQEVELFGRKFSSPFGIAPMGIAGVFAFEGDLQMARAAKRLNVPFTLSNVSTVTMERVAEECTHARWLQAYLSNEREQAARFCARAKAAGFELLMVTLDTPVGSNRENNVRNGFTLPIPLTPRLLVQGAIHPRWSIETFARTLIKYGVPRFENVETADRPSILAAAHTNLRHRRDAVDWEFIRYLRDQWGGRLLVKGVLHPADAEMAVRVGLDGVVVSNHGGRQLESAISPIEALPDIRAAVGTKLKLIADSGFRRGTDILKALTLGADFILLGRAAMYGVVAGGEEGVVHALSLIKTEVDRDLALVGCPSIAELNVDLLDMHGLPQRFMPSAVRPTVSATIR